MPELNGEGFVVADAVIVVLGHREETRVWRRSGQPGITASVTRDTGSPGEHIGVVRFEQVEAVIAHIANRKDIMVSDRVLDLEVPFEHLSGFEGAGKRCETRQTEGSWRHRGFNLGQGVAGCKAVEEGIR